MYCYAFGFTMLMLTKYHECPGAEYHMFNEKEWLTFYVLICLGNFAKDHISQKIATWYNEGQMTYR